MTESVDIREVIQKSTSEVSLQDLTKKGFKQVKVLNQASISRLVASAVDAVLQTRTAEISECERGKVIEESKQQFETLARERMAEQAKVDALVHERDTAVAGFETARSKLEQLLDRFEAVTVERDDLQERFDLLKSRLEGAASLQGERDQAVEMQNQLEARISELTGEVGEREQRIATLQADLEARDGADQEETRRLEEQLAQMRVRSEEQVGGLERQLEESHRRVAELEAECASRTAAIGEEQSRNSRELEETREKLGTAEKALAVSEGMLAAKQEEIERLRTHGEEVAAKISADLTERLEAVEGNRSGGASDEELKSMLSGIQENMRYMSASAKAAAVGEDMDAEALVRLAERGADEVGMESNFGQVEVKQTKATGVNSTLAKLKALQQGAKGEDGGDES